MMGDRRVSGQPQPADLLNTCSGDDLQPCPGACPRDPGSHPGPPEPHGQRTWPLGPPESAGPGAPHGGSGVESSSSRGEPLGCSRPRGCAPQGRSSSSTQVVFWAGILQAQMCVLDLEEELEKTEGLRAELRCCLPPPPPQLHAGLSALPPAEEDFREESSESEEENQAWPGADTPGSSLEWGAEEESVFFDNPLFLESPRPDTSAAGDCSAWGLPDSQASVRAWPTDPHTPPSPPPGRAVSPEPGSGPRVESSSTSSSGRSTPPFPVPSYKSHPFCWAAQAPTGGASAASSGEEEDAAPLEDNPGPASPVVSGVDQVLTQEMGHTGPDLGPHPRPARHRVPSSPEDLQMEEGPPRPLELLLPNDPGEKDTGHLQQPAPCAQASGPCGSPVSLPEPSGPVSEAAALGPVSSPEGSPERQCRSPGSFPKWPPDASYPLPLEMDEAEPGSPKEEGAAETPDPRQEGKREDTPRTAEAAGAQLNVHLPSTEGPPESPAPHAQLPEEGLSPPAGAKLANGVRNDPEARSLASRLYRLEGFRKSQVAAYLRKNNDFSRAVAEEYLSFFHFGGQSLDQALRGFLQALVLSGETQERERILYQFSRRFHRCNPGAFPSVDSIHTLTCAIMLLNTDLHGQNIGKSMNCQEFITNLKGLQDGSNFPKELLKALYWSIRTEKLEWTVDEEDTARPEKAQPAPPASKMTNPFLQLARDPTVPTYKQGFLARKMHQDADGKKTPWGKRGWKMFHTLLRGMALYFLKGEEQSPGGEGPAGPMADEPVGVHHSLASPAAHYTKRPHVFQLRTADWRLYLFQAPTAREMTSWISRINLAAATHSAPPFPAAVGSQRRFVRPILPVRPARGSLEEQHRSHGHCLDAAAHDLRDLQRRRAPDGRGRGREPDEFRLREAFLEHEKARYETYVQLLVARLRCPSGDLALWEEQLGREAAGPPRTPKPGLKKSHSSPSLHQEEAPTTAKVKRHVSERRTYRKIIPKRNRNPL
ncbi:PH and SEC7 domain-containing protein 4 [Perognathus longimembris pacificus]|uniref:PH and SEC7 domain-containing protein 4 n=1 Tax=Perognathus longimembris pacificus TaxID=214514 RepID=UPI00201976EA|nr:PH and SEC7 domain-containing protein 4 [Perognathus longimembris pacificus]